MSSVFEISHLFPRKVNFIAMYVYKPETNFLRFPVIITPSKLLYYKIGAFTNFFHKQTSSFSWSSSHTHARTLTHVALNHLQISFI